MKTMAAGLLIVISACLNLCQAVLLRSEPEPCNLYKCSDGMVPKISHHELTGDSDRECCDETCGHWVQNTGCGTGYMVNEEYFTNVGKSDQICCDKQCGHNWQCKKGYTPSAPNLPGTQHEECCQETCELWNCTELWATDDAKLHLVGRSDKECCAPTCAQFDCQSEGPWWFPDPSRNHTAGASTDECCMPQCRHQDVIQCQDGYRVPTSKENVTTLEGEEFCCDITCKAYNCSDGWTKNMSAIHDFGSNDTKCCVELCQLFTCDIADGWANDSALDPITGKTSEDCCRPTCRQHTCNITEMWLAPGNTKENVTGDSGEVCCEQSCLNHTCAAGRVLFPPANETIGAIDDVCCEDDRCPTFRHNMTKMSENEFCNQYDEAECPTMYFSMNGTLLSCQWDITYRLCRYDTVTRVIGCYGL